MSMIQKMPVKTTMMEMIKRVVSSVKGEVPMAMATSDVVDMDTAAMGMANMDTAAGMEVMDMAVSMEDMDMAAGMEDMDIDDMEATESVMVASITSDRLSLEPRTGLLLMDTIYKKNMLN